MEKTSSSAIQISAVACTAPGEWCEDYSLHQSLPPAVFMMAKQSPLPLSIPPT